MVNTECEECGHLFEGEELGQCPKCGSDRLYRFSRYAPA